VQPGALGPPSPPSASARPACTCTHVASAPQWLGVLPTSMNWRGRPSALTGKGLARFAILCQCALPTSNSTTARPALQSTLPAIHRPPCFSLFVHVVCLRVLGFPNPTGIRFLRRRRHHQPFACFF